MADRVILHCDMNCFFASVELLDRPDLVDMPVAVAGSADKRHGIILAKNEIAKKQGVVTAETIWQAKSKCPNLVLLEPHYAKYKENFYKINKIYMRYTDMVEPFSIDESWLDVTASQKLFGDGKTIADSIRKAVKEELGLTLSAGVSYNKIFAKMGSDYKKPDATTVISRENFKELLWPLPTREMFFCGKASSKKLETIGITTIGDIAKANPKVLTKLLGKQGELLWTYANGYDDTPVGHFDDYEQEKSIGHGITFTRDLVTEDDLNTALTALSDKVASRIRRAKLKATGVKVDLKDPYFKSISRQKQLLTPTNTAEEIKYAALELIHANWQVGSPIRLLTVTGIGLVSENEDVQLNLFESDVIHKEKAETAERAMDEIRKKYGSDAISFASVINSDLGLEDHRDK